MLCSAGSGQQDVVTEIVIHGNRRIPAETVRARIFTRPATSMTPPPWSVTSTHLWNTGYFEDIRFEREQTPKGWRIHVYVKERPTIREIEYLGLSSVSNSDMLDRFKERKVGLSPESQYDPTKVKKAEVTIKELLSEHGRQFATVRTEVRPIPPAKVSVTFVVKEGPKVKVGKITFDGNKHVKLAHSSRRDEEPEADRHSALHLPGKSLCQDLRRHQAGRRYGTGSGGIPEPRLFQSRWCRIPKPRFTIPGTRDFISRC